jgi:transcriptional regulator with XRE-family HTH domain
MTVGERVLKIAKAAGLSRADLAERVGVNPSALTHWGKGESNPSIEKIPDIAKILGVTIGHLFGEEGEGRSYDLESVRSDNSDADDIQLSGGIGNNERSDYREIIKTHASTLATNADAIVTLSNTNASQHRLIEMMVDNKTVKRNSSI